MFKKVMAVLGVLIFLWGFLGIANAQEWETVKDPVKIFEEGYIQVIGYSEEGQSRYRAIRSAEVVAQRELLEVLQGLHLYGETTVKDGMLQSDVIRTRVQGFLRGAIKCGEKYYPDRGYAEVCLRLYIRGKGGMYDIILPLLKDQGLTPTSFPEYKPKMIVKEMPTVPKAEHKVEVTKPEEGKKPEVAPPSQLKEVYDGLIVDVRDYAFKPALVNRIITDKNEVVFDPSKIVSNILVERGCGGFTTDLSKAKALLASWGAKNPMIVKAIGVYKSTDAKVSSDDAAAIYVHDQRTNFLAQARVVFLLK